MPQEPAVEAQRKGDEERDLAEWEKPKPEGVVAEEETIAGSVSSFLNKLW